MKKPKKLLYQKNTLAYSLMLVYILALIIYVIYVLRSMTVSYAIAGVSLVNIITLLVAFLVAEEIKIYNSKYQIVPLVFASIQLYQLVNIPEGLAGTNLVIVYISGAIAIICSVTASLVAIHKNRIRARVIEENNVKATHLAK